MVWLSLGFSSEQTTFYKMLYFALILSSKWYPYSEYFLGIGKQIVLTAYYCEFYVQRQESVAQIILKGLL